jgi:secreted PhoX family phosphatase
VKRADPKLRRRALLKAGGVAALSAWTASGPQRAAAADGADPDHGLVRDPHGILDLPPDFSYRVLQRFGQRMTDGFRGPGRPDAMGCFAGRDGRVVLMRNHEIFAGDAALGPYFPGQEPPAEAYDARGMGGVTRLVLDADTLELKSSNLVLCGTSVNCAGGLSPWGWLSCEETVDDPRHGYVFVCSNHAERVQPARRIPSYGRMRHEAAAVDPRSLIAYLTEDRPDGCFYRFVPASPQQPFTGELQALRIAGQPRFMTREQRPGTRLPVEWVGLEEPDSADDSLRARAVAKGAAVVCRGEGLWLAGERAYFCATAGGPLGRGQVFELGLGAQPKLRVVAECNDPEILDMPDNLCVSPRGELYVAEDGPGGDFIRRIDPSGSVLPFARNALSDSEFAGPCFSPDGRTLFVNIQDDGLTLAIRGPFERPLQAPGVRRAAGARRARPDLARGARGLGTGLTVLALAALARRRRSARN